MTLSIPMFDPLAAANQLIVVAVMIIVLFFLYTYRQNVLLALTGDTHVHADMLDCIWYMMTCGRNCNGEWTRHVTRWTCFCPCWPCKDLVGENLFKSIGRKLGLSSDVLELKNITVGDLPFSGRGDFFLEVTCASNPAQVTSLAEDKDPKVVHFPEVLTLRIRDSVLENRVKFEVKELNVLGSQSLCVCHINAQQMVSWMKDSDERERTKRVEMKCLDTEFEVESPAWLFLNISEPTEARELQRLGANPNVVRTATDGHWRDNTFKETKNFYRLLNSSGEVVQEPYEEDLWKIRCYRTILVYFMLWFNAIVIIVIGLYSILRFYLYSCYMQFRLLTIAKLHNRSFPIATHELNTLKEDCQEEVRGTGIAHVPCRPTNTQIEVTCQNLPPGQPEPGAGKLLAKSALDLDIHGLQCYRGKGVHGGSPLQHLFDRIDADDVCELRNEIAPFDIEIFTVMFLLIASTCCVRMGANACIRAARTQSQKNRGKDLDAALKKLEEAKKDKTMGS